MLIEVPKKASKKIVVKRDGKKVEFNGAKIALAIQKGFEDVIKNEDTPKYNETDVNLVYSKVLTRIEKIDSEKIKIEEIQDLIEEELKENNYQDVYEAFSNYREKRAHSRKLFFDEKKQHKFLKAIENLGLKSANVEENTSKETAMETMLQYGSAISRQFAVTYLMKKKFAQAHENGDIYIHDMNFLPMGTTNCCQIDIQKIQEESLKSESNLNQAENIIDYITLMINILQISQNEQHGGQGIPAFDYYIESGILKTFKNELKHTIFEYLELTDFDKFIAINGIEREIEKINSIQIEESTFDKYCRQSEELKRIFRIAYKKALEKTDNIVYQAMQTMIQNINGMYSKTGRKKPLSISLGTNTSQEGKMATKNLLNAIKTEKQECLLTINFKIKEKINYNSEDPNYDLLELACQVLSNKQCINFIFLDAPFNNEFYKSNNYTTEVAYMSYCTRVIENIVDSNKAIVTRRGNLCTTTINLPRLGIKARKNSK